jgi:DNA-binding response OmpR family regulator
VEVSHAFDGEGGLREAIRGRPDVVILDLMLPKRSGLEVCLALREQSDVPIIVLTARAEEADRVLGLEVGADDYLVKPFSSRELLARVRAIVRRARGQAGPSSKPIRAGRLTLHPGSMRATLDGRPLSLTAYEFGLLRVFAERRGHVLTREQRLRQKLGDDPKRPTLLKTVRSVGYVLATEEEP